MLTKKSIALFLSLFSVFLCTAGAELSYKIDLYPVMYENGNFTICENLPGQLAIIPKAKGSYQGKTARMYMEVPEFVKLTAVCEDMTLSSQTGRVPRQLVSKGTKVRDGVKYTAYEVDFPPVFLHFIRNSWYNYHIFFKPEPRSKGKSGRIYWSFAIGEEKQPEKSFTVKIIDPVKKPESPCKIFNVAIANVQSAYVPTLKEESSIAVDYWKSLSEKRVTWYRSHRDTNIKFPGFEMSLQVFGGNFNSSLWQDDMFAMRNNFPGDTKADGTPNGDQCSVWALLDDKDGVYEKYLRNAFRKIPKVYPECKVIEWDFEPRPLGYDEGGRARFARKLGLPGTPTLAEVNGKYSRQWFNYMVKLHAEFINKVAKIAKEELPDVKFALCSDNLHAAPPHIAAWCGIDVSLSDHAIDIHAHMPYYTGVRYFDDMVYNVTKLKKPYFPLIDPAERSIGFYSQYTPAKVMQNIVATAANGARGISIYPDDTLKGEYFHSIAEGFGKAAQGEEYYFKGERCDRDFTLTPKNAVTCTLPNGKVITSPDFSRTMRYTAHKLKDKYLFTIFNYDEKRSMIVEVKGKGVTPFLVEVPPSGCELAGTDFMPPQEKLRSELKKSFGNANIFKSHVRGRKSARWDADSQGNPVLKISDGLLTAGVDMLGEGEVTSLVTGSNAELLTSGFAGKIMFDDKLQPKLQFKYVGHGIDKKGVPFVAAEAEVAPYEGANPIPNPLYRMKITRRFEIRDGKLIVKVDFVNPADKDMPLKGRLNNYPWPGQRFQADKVALITQKPMPEGVDAFLRKPAWDGRAVTLTATDGVLKEGLLFTPDKKFTGIYSWSQTSGQPRKTVEFLIDGSLKAQSGLKFIYSVEIKK